MDQYVVLCDCSSETPAIVGFIDDDRAESGRFGFDAWPPQPDAVFVTPKKRGDRRPSRKLNCPHCNLGVSLSHTTTAEIVDLIRQQQPGGGSLRDSWGKTAIPFEDYADDDARAAAAVEFEEMLWGVRDQTRPTDVPMVTRWVYLHVIPFVELRRLVSKLDKRQ